MRPLDAKLLALTRDEIRPRGPFDASSPPTGGWGSDTKGADGTDEIRPRGPSDASSPPTGGWGSDTKGAGGINEIRPRGPSDASSPPSGGWGSGTQGAGGAKRVRSRGSLDVTDPPLGGRGSGPGRDRAKGFPSVRLTTPLSIRSPQGSRGAVRRPSAFVSVWDRLPRGAECREFGRQRNANHQRMWATRRRPNPQQIMSSPPAMGITEEVYPWTD
jgi:hypothetical protein